jgi:hypothetical protein
MEICPVEAELFMQMDRQTYRQAYGRKDRQKERHMTTDNGNLLQFWEGT